MITIGQLAAYAGVTIKAVRHYHKRGLLEEPTRDSSGYRRYTAEQAIHLIKIKTLAEAGVPLARIKEMLTADADRFATALAEIDRTLKHRAEELVRARERIGRLSSGDRLFVRADVADYLDHLRELGVSERIVQMERDGWILLQSVSPKEAAVWIADKREALRDPEFQAIYLEFDAAFDWSPTTAASTPWPTVPSAGWPAGPPGLSAESVRSRTRPSQSWSRRPPGCRRRPGTGSPRSPGSAWRPRARVRPASLLTRSPFHLSRGLSTPGPRMPGARY